MTSAVHMPRAFGAFERVGFPVLPWPIDDTPRVGKDLTARVWHEVRGLVGYRAFGRTRQALPERVGAGTRMHDVTAASSPIEH